MKKTHKKKIYKCPHHYVKYKCPICNLHNMCEHHKYNRICIKCNLSLLCIHKKEKYSCVICKPYLICKHNIRRHKCNECKIKNKNNNTNNAKNVCIHKYIRTECMFCHLIHYT